MGFHRTVSLMRGICILLLASQAAPAQEIAAPRASIRPSVARVAPGRTQQFRVVLAPGWLRAAQVASGVAWTVNGVPGGSTRVGTIDRGGLYRAPTGAKRAREVHIGATVKTAVNRHVWATAIVGAGQPAYALVTKWEEPSDGSVHLKDPTAIAVDPEGNLVIADMGASKVFRYSPKGAFLGTLGGGSGNTVGALAGPRAIAVDAAGRVYVGDLHTGPPRIQVFGRVGKLLHAFGQKGIGPGKVMLPQAMTVDPTGRLLVADAECMRVTIYRRDGTLLDTWQRSGTGAGELNEPYGVVADANGDVFVPGYYGPCQKFTSRGELLFAFAHPGPPRGPVVFTSASGDRWGNVFLAVRDSRGIVTNSANPEPKPARILKYNNSGDLVATIPLWGDECGENAAAVDGQDRLYVLFKRGKSAGVAVFAPQ